VELISETYRAEQERLHALGNYGTASIGYAPLVTQIIDRMGVTNLLDYGCGRQMNLLKSMRPNHKVTYQAYDPGVPALAGAPVPAQLVCCIDVLEHIEPELLDNVLDDLKRVTQAAIFCTVHTGPAVKTLSDGRNAHLIQQPMEWWMPKLWARFDIQTFQVTGEQGFYVIGFAKSNLIENERGEKVA
jgi:hypothetical protein